MATSLIPSNGSACRHQRSYEERLVALPDHQLQEVAYGLWSYVSFGGGANQYAQAAREESRRRHSRDVQDREWARLQMEGFGL
jgi:hypothetical protein